ncbi:hypothetical protein AEYBE204_11875 [Asticcacaulis sp. YBE204]|nr:hypothetical protein AEYBE204_11875 [Asticcacaulis sp. YBE204]
MGHTLKTVIGLRQPDVAPRRYLRVALREKTPGGQRALNQCGPNITLQIENDIDQGFALEIVVDIERTPGRTRCPGRITQA